MGLHHLLNRLKCGVSDAPDTSEKSVGYQAKPSIGAGCTLDTPDTSPIACNTETAANDDVAPRYVSFLPGASSDALVSLRAASLALGKVQAATPPDTPDASCWPLCSAMTSAEIDTFTARLARFTDMGLDLDAGERLADKLLIRDRDQDDRRLCLECMHLCRGWRCGNWQRAGIAIQARDAQLPTDFVNLLQRCGGFANAVQIPSMAPFAEIVARGITEIV